MHGEAHDAGNNLELARKWKSAGRLADAAGLLEQTLADSPDGFRVETLRELADIHAKRGAWGDAEKRIDEALSVPGISTQWRARLLERRAWILFRQEKFDEAERLAHEVIHDLDEASDPATAASLHNTLAGAAWRKAECDVAASEVERAATLYERAHEPCGSANAMTNLGVLHLTQGEWQKAAVAFAESEKIRRSNALIPGRSANLLSLGWLEAIRGNRAQAREHLDESRRVANEADEQYDVTHADLALAYLDVLESRLDDACRHLEPVLQRQDLLCDGDLAQTQWLQALIQCDRGGHERAVDLALKARDTARSRNLPECQIDAARALGIAYERCEKFPDAEKVLTESAELAERVRDPYRRGLALLELGRLYEGAADRRDAARERVDEATAVFERLGARCDYDRAQALRLRMAH